MASSEDGLGRLSVALADRYRIEREIGSGGMATDHLAEDLEPHGTMAVRILPAELVEAGNGGHSLP